MGVYGVCSCNNTSLRMVLGNQALNYGIKFSGLFHKDQLLKLYDSNSKLFLYHAMLPFFFECVFTSTTKLGFLTRCPPCRSLFQKAPAKIS